MRTAVKAGIFLLALLIAEVVFKSCRKPETYYSRFDKVFAEVVNRKGNDIEYVGEFATVPDSTYLIQANFTDQRWTHLIAPPSFLLGSAYAYQEFNYYYNRSRLKSITIKTVNDWNDTFPSGSDITAQCIFGILANDLADSTAAGLITSFNKNVEETGGRDRSINYSFFIKPIAKPKAGGPHSFVLSIELEDGRILEDTSLPFFVK
jgi:hypothetical protein